MGLRICEVEKPADPHANALYLELGKYSNFLYGKVVGFAICIYIYIYCPTLFFENN